MNKTKSFKLTFNFLKFENLANQVCLHTSVFNFCHSDTLTGSMLYYLKQMIACGK